MRNALWLVLVLVLAACNQTADTQPPDLDEASLAGQLCPAWVHDRHQVKGPDGLMYPTWHPQIDPVYKCYFNHEHGDDPRTAVANKSLPPFGYLAKLHGMTEPHEGFKVFVVNRNTRNDEGRTALTSTRLVVHMGTAAVGRFTNRFHTFMFDLVASTGHRVSVQGMADTQMGGSICQRDRLNSDNDPSNDIGRTFVTVPSSGCDLGSLYEIWQFSFNAGNKATVIASVAAFDPITALDPANPTRLVYTADVYPQFGSARGCNREAYHGPVYWYNRFGPTEFFTDVMGVEGGPHGRVKQVVSKHTDIGIPMSRRSDGTQTLFKFHRPNCASGIGLKN